VTTYEPADLTHAYIHCRKCGRFEDVPFAVVPQTLSALFESRGFRIDFGVVTFAGSRAACRDGAPRPDVTIGR